MITSPAVKSGDYVLSGDRPRSMREMFTIIAEALGSDARFPSVPYAVALAGATSARFLTRGRVDYVERVQRMTEDRSFSHAAATADFGYAPMPFEEGDRDRGR